VINISHAAIAAVLFASLNLAGNVPVTGSSGVQLPDPPGTETNVSVYFLRTGGAETLEAFTLAGGSLTKILEIVRGSIVVEHGSESFLFDTGLERNIDTQYEEDMPAMVHPFMTYSKAHSVVELLSRSSGTA
jgi:hypothetical protein